MPQRPFTGTFDDTGLQGPPGPAGAPGPTGPQGPLGPAGADGPAYDDSVLAARISVLEALHAVEPPIEPPPIEPPPNMGTVLTPADDVQAWLNEHPGEAVTLSGAFFGLHIDVWNPATVYLAPGTVWDGQGATFAVQQRGVDGFELIGVPDAQGKRPVVKNYICGQQDGGIQGEGVGDWRIENLEITNIRNSGWGQGAYGISMGDRMIVRNCLLAWNASLGIGGHGDDCLIEGNEIAYNNWKSHHTEASVASALVTLPVGDFPAWLAEYEVPPGWEGGGTKFVGTRNLTVRNNYVHHNGGYGLWTDIDNIDTLYEGNLCEWNPAIGISHEISYDAIIRNNVCRWNGTSWSDWGFGAQIAVQNSNDTYVHDNQMVVHARAGNGLTQMHQNRGGPSANSPVPEPWESIRNRFINNHITYEGPGGTSGFFDDTAEQKSKQPGVNEWADNVEVRL